MMEAALARTLACARLGAPRASSGSSTLAATALVDLQGKDGPAGAIGTCGWKLSLSGKNQHVFAVIANRELLYDLRLDFQNLANAFQRGLVLRFEDLRSGHMHSRNNARHG